MPKYRLTVPAFIAPEYLKAGTVIEYDGVPSLTYEPLDEAAEAAIAEVYKAKPYALINPVDSLRTVGGSPGEVAPTAKVIEEPKEETDVVNIGNLAQPGKAAPGVTAGGKALPFAK